MTKSEEIIEKYNELCLLKEELENLTSVCEKRIFDRNKVLKYPTNFSTEINLDSFLDSISKKFSFKAVEDYTYEDEGYVFINWDEVNMSDYEYEKYLSDLQFSKEKIERESKNKRLWEEINQLEKTLQDKKKQVYEH